MRKKDTQINLLEGNLTKTIIKLGYPVAIATFVQTLYSLADTFWLGRLGKEALSAPVISFFILFFVLSLGIGLSMAGTSLVSQYIGAKQTGKAEKTTGNLLVYLFVFSVLIAVAGIFFGDPMLKLLRTPAESFQYTSSYFRIMIIGMPFAFPVFVYQSVMNGCGDTISPLKIEFISAMINVVLDPILIFGLFGFPSLGVAGAAYASVFSQAIASAIGLYLFFSGKKGIKLKLHHLVPDLKELPLIIKIGIPPAIGMSGASLGFMVLIGIVNQLGTSVVSAYGISTRVIHFFTMPANGVTAAVTAIVGQNLGANNIARARKTVVHGIHLMFMFMIPAITIMVVFGKYLTMFFIPNDPLIHRLGQIMFYIISPSMLFFGLSAVLSGAFQGSGFTLPVMVTNIARIWLFRIPLVYLFTMSVFKGTDTIDSSLGIWWGMFFSNFLSFVVIFLWYLPGKWAKARINNT